MKRQILCFCLLAATLFHLAGCASSDGNRRTISTGTSRVQNSSARTGSQTTANAEKSARTTATGKQAQGVAKRDERFDWQGKAFPTGDPSTSAVLLEKGVPYEVLVGEEFTYQLRVTNISKNSLQQVEVTDSIPASMKVTATEPRSTNRSGGITTWSLGNMAPGETRTIDVLGSTARAEPMNSCASVSFDSSVCAVIPVVQPAIQLTKQITSEALVCEPILARYVVKNTGTGTARDLQITEQLPANLVTKSGGNTVRFQVPALNAGKSREFTIELRAEKKGVFESKATVKGSGALAAASTQTRTTVRHPDLKLVAVGPKEAYLARAVTYEWTVTNVGDGLADKSTVEGSIPRGASFVSATAGGRRVGDKVVWSLGKLDPQATKKVSVTFKGKDAATLESQGTAKALCADNATASVQTRFVGIPAILLEVVDEEDPIMVGDFETYTIRVTNQGTAPGTNIRIDCILEANLVYVSATGATRGQISGGKVSFSALPSLAPKAEAIWKVKVKATKKGDSRFRVALTSDQMQRPVEETEATNVYQ